MNGDDMMTHWHIDTMAMTEKILSWLLSWAVMDAVMSCHRSHHTLQVFNNGIFHVATNSLILPISGWLRQTDLFEGEMFVLFIERIQRGAKELMWRSISFKTIWCGFYHPLWGHEDVASLAFCQDSKCYEWAGTLNCFPFCLSGDCKVTHT